MRRQWFLDPLVGKRLLEGAAILSALFIVLLILRPRNIIASIAQHPSLHIETNSTLHRFLNRHPRSLDFPELRHKLLSTYLESRAHAFYLSTRGALRTDFALSVAVEKQLCPENGTKITVLADKELGYNIESYLGQAYYLHLIDCLDSTSGYNGSEAFFFFNPTHHVLPSKAEGTHIWDFSVSFNQWNALAREWDKMTDVERKTYWNPIRSPNYPVTGLLWPPFSRFYTNRFMEKLKPNRSIAIVAGKHYIQWNGDAPINTFAQPEDLSQIFDVLLDNGYVIIYNRIRVNELRVADAEHGQTPDPKDYDMIHEKYEHRDVLTSEDIWYALNPDLPMLQDPLLFNRFQLLLYQQADIYVDTQGGGAVISSLMPGDHFILHRQGSELIRPQEDMDLDAAWVYHRWWRHGGGRFFVYTEMTALVDGLRGVAHANHVLASLNDS